MALAAGVLVASLSLLTGTARADDEDGAAREFARGVELFDAQHYHDAAEAFANAERRAPRGPTAYNAARAYAAAGSSPRAADELSNALRLGGLTPEQATNAAEELRRLEASLATLDLFGPPGASARIGTHEVALPSRMHVQPGWHDVVFTRGAAVDEQHVSLQAGAQLTMRMRWTPAPARPKSADVRTPLAAGLLVVGVVAIASAIAIGAEGAEARDRFVDSGRLNGSVRDSALSSRTVATVVGTIGVLSAGGGILLFATAPSKSSESTTRAASVGLGIAPTGASLTGAW